MTTRIYVVKTAVNSDPTAPGALQAVPSEAVVELEQPGADTEIVSIVTTVAIDRELNAADGVIEFTSGEFAYDGETWCLSGTDRGNGWETDDYEAADEAEALRDAIAYLIEFNPTLSSLSPAWRRPTGEDGLTNLGQVTVTISVTEKLSDLANYANLEMDLWLTPGANKPYWASQRSFMYDRKVASPWDFLEAVGYDSFNDDPDYSENDEEITIDVQYIDPEPYA